MTVREIGLEELLRRDGGVVLHVGSPTESAAGHVPGAMNLPLDAMSEAARGSPGRTW